jgi:hypothetical protein
MPATHVGPPAECRQVNDEGVAADFGANVKAPRTQEPLPRTPSCKIRQAQAAEDRGDALRESPEPVLHLDVHRTVAALTHLALLFKRLRDRTDTSPRPGSPPSTPETRL